MSAQSVYIPDGYTESAYVAAVPRLHGAIRFSFRPLTYLERSALLRENASRTPAAADQATAEAVAKRIVAWDVRGKDREGNEVAIEPTARALGNLRPALAARIIAITTGFEAGDEDPQTSEVDRQELQAAKREAADRGVLPGEARAERDAGN